MEHYFTLAGAIVCITGKEGELFSDPGILEGFEVKPQSWDYCFRVKLVEELTPSQGNLVYQDPARRVFSDEDQIVTYFGSVEQSLEHAYIRTVRQAKQWSAEMKRSEFRGPISPKTVLNALDAPHLAVENGGFLLHASCICCNGKAIVFTAPSGTGKSTQAALWETHRQARIINGDRIMLRMNEDGCEAVGVPFAGSSDIRVNCVLPLRAIVVLSQEKSTSIQKLTGLQAFRAIWEGCSVHTWERQDLERCIQTVEKMISQIPVFHLGCTPDESAVLALEEMLHREEAGT